MLMPSLPRSLADLLIVFRPCFTAPTFATFRAMVAGFLAQPGLHTVTGMLVGARLAGRRHHDLAYRFFSTARWSADQLGLVLLDLICATLVPADAPLVLAVDDTLWHRTGRKLHGAAWHHDGNGPGRHRPAWGHRWVVVGVIVHLPFLTRAVCLPILARLWQPGDPDHTPLVLARELVDLACGHLGDRQVHLVGDAADIGKPLQGLPTPVTVTARLRANGALKGQPVQVVLSRPVGSPDGYELALVTTDLAATPTQVIERYADRWSEETAFLDARHLAGVGQARTRTQRSVERLVPFGLVCMSLAIVWYAHHGHPAADLAAHRARAPWYRHKHTVSVADMLASLRRALLHAQYPHGHPHQHTLDLFPDALLTQLHPAA